jgi:predicted esterase
MRYFAVFILLLLFPCTGIASLRVQKDTFVSHNKKRTFYLFVPENLKPSAPAPLILLLHGSGRDGLSLVDKWKELAEKEGIILAGPNSADLDHWNTNEDGPTVMHDLIELLRSRYSIDSRRVYLFGHSGGAVYAILLSLMESEYFAATAIHAGALQDKNEFKFIDGSHRKIPLAIWVGTNDQFFPLSSVRATRDALMAKGFPVEVTEMPGHDHWYYDLAPRINEAAWQFLRKYALPAEPHFESYAEVDSGAEVNRAIAEVNKVLAEINVLKGRISDLITTVNAKEAALNAKDFGKDRSEINKIAQEETDLLKEAAAIARSIADKASQVNAAKLEGKYPLYLELVAQHNRKYASMLDVMAEQAATLLGNESFEVINAKRAEARKRIEALRKEADDLYNQAEKIVH